MAYKLITTIENNIIYCGLFSEKNQLIELHPINMNSKGSYTSHVGNIYIGKVASVVNGLNSAFIDIGLNENAFLSLKDVSNVMYTSNKEMTTPIKQGDEIIVQVTKDAYDEKGAKVTTDISIVGRNCILTRNKCFLGISSKITDMNERNKLKKVFNKYINEEYGFIARTNAKDMSEEEITMEIEGLINDYNDIINKSKYRTVKQCLYSQPPKHISILRDLFYSDIEEYVYDDESLYNEAKIYIENNFSRELSKLRLFSDESINLFNIYGFKGKIGKALQEKVWLKSGASVIIQNTEALVVIDVNTNKFSGKKNAQDTILKTNLEAAEEIARQIRLRNLSGIIIIDFIDMPTKENKDLLMKTLDELFKHDRIKTNLIDMTPLGLVEVTRKKAERTLSEKLKGFIQEFEEELYDNKVGNKH